VFIHFYINYQLQVEYVSERDLRMSGIPPKSWQPPTVLMQTT